MSTASSPLSKRFWGELVKAYLDTAREVLDKGTRKENRTGVDTISTFNINHEIELEAGFPLLTTKKISWNAVCEQRMV